MSNFELIGGIGIMGFISPMNTEDTYAVIDPIYGVDGLRNVSAVEDLNLISFERRRPGMIVGVNGGEQYFKLKKISWVNQLTDWVEIDLSKTFYIDKEVPSGVINDYNHIYELSKIPIPNSEHIYLNGLLQDEDDYGIMDNVITFYDPPTFGMKLKCSYRTIN
jgi:hypothetical protein